jgi:biopolymer transport protein ExbB/TolQ
MDISLIIDRLVSQSPWTWALIGGFLVAVVCFLVRQLRRMACADRTLHESILELEKCSKKLDRERTRQAIVSGAYAREVEASTKSLQPATLREQVNRYRVLVADTGQFYDPELFIRQQYRQQEHEALLGASRVFVQLGLIGTFLGLVFGLFSINVSGTEELTQSIFATLEGMALAFITSLLGLLFAFIYNIRARHFEDHHEDWDDRLSGFLGQHVAPAYCISSDAALADVARSVTTNLDRLGDVATRLSQESETTFNRLAETAGTLFSGIQASVEQIVETSRSLDSGTAQLAPLLEKLNEGISALKNGLDEQTKSALRGIEEVASHIDEVVSGMKGSFESLASDIRGASQHQLAAANESRVLIGELPNIVAALANAPRPRDGEDA